MGIYLENICPLSIASEDVCRKCLEESCRLWCVENNCCYLEVVGEYFKRRLERDNK